MQSSATETWGLKDLSTPHHDGHDSLFRPLLALWHLYNIDGEMVDIKSAKWWAVEFTNSQRIRSQGYRKQCHAQIWTVSLYQYHSWMLWILGSCYLLSTRLHWSTDIWLMTPFSGYFPCFMRGQSHLTQKCMQICMDFYLYICVNFWYPEQNETWRHLHRSIPCCNNQL